MAQFIIWNSYDFSKHTTVRPLGPHQLACWLNQNGYTVKVIDYCSLMTPMEIANVTAHFIGPETVAIGVSNTFWDEDPMKNTEPEWVLHARAFIERRYPNLDWVLGGSRNSFLVMNLKQQWIKITGYAEDQILKYLDSKTNKLALRKPFDIQNNPGHFLDDLHIQPSEVLPIELSRGCQFKCKFCRFGELGKKKNTYIRDYKLIESELLENYERFGVTRYMMMDDTCNESIEKITALAEIAQRLPFKLEWMGYVRLDLIGSNPDTAQILLDSGLKACFFGVESYHPKASKAIGKGWNGAKGKEFLLELKNNIWNNQVHIHTNLIAGLPGEPVESLEETQQWCIDNEIPSWFWTALSISRAPTQLWKSEFDLEYEKYGYRFTDVDDPYFWTNDMWDYNQARAKVAELNEESLKYVRINPWHAAMVAGMGYEFDDIVKLSHSELDYHTMFARAQERVRDYIAYQKSIGNAPR